MRNNNTTNAAVLTVGSDNNSQEYDGTFLDGTNGSLGLTKVGGGILTLTGINSNSGPVTVSGGSIALTTGGPAEQRSVHESVAISTASGASLNVSGRPDNTLTLNSNQRLAGKGTVTGNKSSSIQGQLSTPDCQPAPLTCPVQ